MTDSLAEYPIEDLVALHAVGALTAEESDAFERRREAGWPEVEQLLLDLTPAVAELAADIPAVVPPPAVKAAVFDALFGEHRPPVPPPGYTILPGDDTAFRPSPHTGVSVRILNIDRRRNQFSCLMRFQPGARLPGHHHSAVEECVVLEGSLVVAGVRMRAGDYQRVEAGVDHADQWSDTGALAFVTAPLDLLHD
jgi:quercetin dioxygenase-like cupin family protein